MSVWKYKLYTEGKNKISGLLQQNKKCQSIISDPRKTLILIREKEKGEIGRWGKFREFEFMNPISFCY